MWGIFMITLIVEAVSSSAKTRRDFADQRMAELKAARAAGRVDGKTFSEKLGYWQRIKNGISGSKRSNESGKTVSRSDLLNTGQYF